MYICVSLRDIKGMTKKIVKKDTRDALTAAMVKKTASITGVSERSVYRVLEGSQKNEDVLSTYMFLQEGDNLLLQSAKQLIPFKKQQCS